MGLGFVAGVSFGCAGRSGKNVGTAYEGSCVRTRAAWSVRRVRGMTMAGAGQVDMPQKLEAEVNKFRNVPDAKLRYQQLLFYAKQLPPMDARYKVPENKVPGCLSTVFVHVELSSEGIVDLSGDSDAQLTKGLIALLINSFSGATVKQILNVTPDFIKESGLDVSLTPGRNNGFLNMLATIKQKVKGLANNTEAQEESPSPMTTESAAKGEQVGDEGRPMYSAIVSRLGKLQPSRLIVTDNSAQHAGHAGARGLNGESHFAVEIVSEFFDGLSLVKRHQLVYGLLAEQMQAGIHALQIDAKAPSEVS
ncbi:SufE-like protein 1, chloroplastic/mitochondrial [Porphyridium purpureum]|uniref:SufE-like protein 1, chloroplastic/mitochondrial n=1 Tax=Porphyridium purpureum TaxID=35688 RepID=A0A5J4YTJ6_PORPP|nr:SufE-like protein 1, chloroplastic/mitochondrial [Porphyridium purpureum]|eukprot:POR7099..scf229_5